MFAAPTHPAAPFQDAADGITNAAEFVPTLVVSAAVVLATKDIAAATFIQSGCDPPPMTAAPDMLDKEARSQRQLTTLGTFARRTC